MAVKHVDRVQPEQLPSHDHDHHSGHHHHAASLTRSRLRLAFLLTLLILIVEVAGGLLGNSLALLGDAGHVVTDAFALGLAWFAGAQAERPANERNTFGYHRVGILAALTNAVTLIAVAAWLTYEAIGRLMHPQPVQPLVMFLSASVGVAVNLFIAFGMRGAGHENLNVRGALLHAIGDIGASFGVIVAGGIILLTGWSLADPILSVGIALLISFSAFRLVRETLAILMESAPRHLPVNQLANDIQALKGVCGVHDLHVWNITSGVCALSCHVIISEREQTLSKPPMLDRISQMLADKYHIQHTTIQIETQRHTSHKTRPACSTNALYCDLNRCCGD